MICQKSKRESNNTEEEEKELVLLSNKLNCANKYNDVKDFYSEK